MDSDNMVRRQLYLSQNLNHKLKGWAKERKVSESEIIREALTQFLEREKRRVTLPEDNPVLRMKGIFAGDEGCSLAGEKHDEVLYNIGNKE